MKFNIKSLLALIVMTHYILVDLSRLTLIAIVLSSFFASSDQPGDGSSTSSGVNQSNGGRRRNQRRAQGGPMNFEDILQDILISITDGGNSSGRPPLFFMGNPADYVWGREGLDSIVTQLLNQMDNAGERIICFIR